MISCSNPCPCPTSRLSLERLNSIMRNPIQQAVCFPCCVPCPTPPTWPVKPTKILNVNVNVNVNKQENDPSNTLSAPTLNGADLEQKIRSAVNTALGEE